jgi:hypothetical protein
MLKTAEPFEVIGFADPAIDLDHPDTNLGRFIRTRDADRYLRFIAGTQPMRFTCRPLTRAHVILEMLSVPDENARRRKAFAWSVVGVKNARLEDGRDVANWRPAAMQETPTHHVRRLGAVMSEDELEDFDVRTILEIGEVVLTRAFFSTRGDAPLYLLPPTSLDLLNRTPRLLAAAVSGMAQREPSSEPPEAEPTSDSASSAGTTAATATG